ncbi:MAG: hypothetical protein HY246_04340 [Proteobacteria bacterium]|nr:hypothetical protein [Pseudomonadota bacterium]
MNHLYVCTLSRVMGTIAASSDVVSLEKPDTYLGEPVIGGWVETTDGRIAIKWGSVPPQIAALPTMFDHYTKALGPAN